MIHPEEPEVSFVELINAEVMKHLEVLLKQLIRASVSKCSCSLLHVNPFGIGMAMFDYIRNVHSLSCIHYIVIHMNQKHNSLSIADPFSCPISFMGPAS